MGNQIREIRRSHGETQQQLADALETTPRAIGYWENESVSLDDAVRVADHYDVPLDDIAGRATPITSEESTLIVMYKQANPIGRKEIRDFATWAAMEHPVI